MTYGAGTARPMMPGEVAVIDFNTSGFATIATFRAFSLEGSSAFIEVPRAPEPATSARFHFIAKHDEENYAELRLRDGVLAAQYYASAVRTVVKQAPYVANEHRWWRLREAGGTTYWEVSDDGAGYSTFAEAPTPVPLRYVRMVLYGFIEDLGDDGGEVHVDNYNGGGAATGHWCPAASFADDFDTPSSDLAWSTLDGDLCEISRTARELRFDLVAAMDTSCSYTTRPRFDLTASSVSVEARAGTGPTPSRPRSPSTWSMYAWWSCP